MRLNNSTSPVFSGRLIYEPNHEKEIERKLENLAPEQLKELDDLKKAIQKNKILDCEIDKNLTPSLIVANSGDCRVIGDVKASAFQQMSEPFWRRKHFYKIVFCDKFGNSDNNYKMGYGDDIWNEVKTFNESSLFNKFKILCDLDVFTQVKSAAELELLDAIEEICKIKYSPIKDPNSHHKNGILNGLKNFCNKCLKVFK